VHVRPQIKQSLLGMGLSDNIGTHLLSGGWGELESAHPGDTGIVSPGKPGPAIV
jgi:hypothetical protein